MASDSEETNKVAENNKTSSSSRKKLQVLPTEIITILPEETPLYLTRSGMRSFNTVATIHTAFLKKSLSESAFAINLYFDSDLENYLYKTLNASENDQIDEIGLNPHTTLTMSPFDNQPTLEYIIKSEATEQETIPFCFGSSLGLTEKNPLNQFHLKLCNALEKEKIEIEEKYRHDSWVPNSRVIADCDQMVILKALTAPYHGCGIKIKLVEYPFYREPYFFDEKAAATLLFRKVISECDHMLSRFSVPKKIAINLKYFPFAYCGRSVEIEVWVPRIEKLGWESWEMVFRHYYMDSMYQIIAFCEKYEEPLNLVAGDTILFYKFESLDGFLFSYRYMMRFEKANHELE